MADAHICAIVDDKTEYVAKTLQVQGMHRVQTAANAELIVRAVNAHDDLVAAVRGFIAHIEGMPDDTEKTRILGLALNNKPGEDLRAALAKAGY